VSGYTKLFGSILASTVWELPLATKVVWITMLAMADRHGEVQASVPGLAKFAGVTREQCEAALEAFLSPDPDSRTKEADGRRLEVIDGGWRLINHEKYSQQLSAEDRRERAAVRQQRFRESHKVTLSNASSRPVADGSACNDTQTQLKTQTQTKKEPDILPTASAGSVDYPGEFEIIWEKTGRRGGKFAAAKAWKKVGKPSWVAVQANWRAYLLSQRPIDGFVQDLSSWLNGRGHTQGWLPGQPKINGRPAPVRAARPSGPPVAIAEAMGQRAAKDAAQLERERLAQGEEFRRNKERDAGVGT
jgi:hypothetical protein